MGREALAGENGMTKAQFISAAILDKIADGMSVQDAMREALGADKVDRMISDLYDELRAKAD